MIIFALVIIMILLTGLVRFIIRNYKDNPEEMILVIGIVFGLLDVMCLICLISQIVCLIKS